MTLLQNPTGRVLHFNVGDRLRKARTTAGYDVRPFAALISVSHGTVTRYELGDLDESKMKPLVLKAWAMATGVDYEWLLTGKGSEITDPDGGNSNLYAPRDSNPEPID